jgi:hypothetical protein
MDDPLVTVPMIWEQKTDLTVILCSVHKVCCAKVMPVAGGLVLRAYCSLPTNCNG